MLLTGAVAAQEPVPRATPIAGEVVAARGGEELQFTSENAWRFAVPRQDLKGGDTVRTNALGNLAILFEDRTQVRVGRNSTMVIKDIAKGPNGETHLELPQGNIWARAARGGSGVMVDTPAAAAAIRGTDWSLTVQGAKTALIVMEGVVTLQNPQGAVTVRQGEGAEAEVGKAPKKITLVNFDGKEQILIYRDLRGSFSDLTPTDLTRPQERAARARALAKPEPARSVDDWLTLAETALTYDGRDVAARALTQASARRLAPAQQARADLVACFIKARGRSWREAADLCKRAQPRLDRKRQATADYLAWVALSMADPNHRPPEPRAGRYAGLSTGVLARASIESFLDTPQKGIDIIEQNEKRFPDDVMMRAGKALLYIMKGDDKGAKKAIDEARAVDPDDLYVLLASARYHYSVDGDLDAALKELRRALEIAPGADLVWNEYAVVLSDRDASREAEAAHHKAIALDPDDPVNYTNYANFLIDESRLPEADAVLGEAEKLDPNDAFLTAVRGRLLVRRGKIAEGTEKLLAASATEPTYAGGLIEIAIANYAAGNLDETNQALDNADRFDDDSPTTPLIRSVIAVDQYRADDAIMNAREALRRRMAKGGYYASIAGSRENGSFVSDSLRFLELDEWARFYGDRVADAFESSSYFDQAISNHAQPFAAATLLSPDDLSQSGTTIASSLVQGLLLDPLAVAGPERRTALAHFPFVETTAGGGFISQRGRTGWLADATLQATVMEPIPAAVYATLSFDQPKSSFPNDRDDGVTGVAFVGVKPTAADNLAFFSVNAREKVGARLFDSVFPAARPNGENTFSSSNGAAWSHTFGERNVLEAMVVGDAVRQTTHRTDNYTAGAGDPTCGVVVPPGGSFLCGLNTRERLKQNDVVGAVSHLIGVGDVTFRYGAESVLSRIGFSQFIRNVPGGVVLDDDNHINGVGWRVYADAVWDVTRDLKLELGGFGDRAEIDHEGKTRFDPRVGVAWQPVDGQWLRAAYRKDTFYTSSYTLTPITTVGLTPNELPLTFGGRVETLAARWDAEWSSRVFTALEYQKQDVRKLSIDVPETVRNVDIAKADIDRLNASLNVWLGHGIGLFANYARTWTKTRSNDGDFFYVVNRGDPVPYLPKNSGRVGLSFVLPWMVKLTVAENFVGRRTQSLPGVLDNFATTDLSMIWEGFDKRLVLGAELLNAFDRKFKISTVGALPLPAVYGQRRTLTATARLRF